MNPTKSGPEMKESSTDALGGLPAADTALLGNAPLEVAIIEVRFTSTSSGFSATEATAIRDELDRATGMDFSSIQPAQQRTVQVDLGAEGAAMTEGQFDGWQISSTAGTSMVTLMPESVVLQTTDYVRWRTSIREPLEVLLAAVVRVTQPTLIQRIGLRYVDRFQDRSCNSVADWVGKIDGALLGPVQNTVFGHRLRAAQQQLEIEIDAHHGAILRHGPIHDPSGSSVDYLLDLDVFRHVAGAFDTSDVVDAAERLNRSALSLFQASIEHEYLESLKEVKPV
jgi:uncharacterized protein (TIGR04255 family)